MNAIAQNFVENPTYFPPEVQANPRFPERLKREEPLGRLVGVRDAHFAAHQAAADAWPLFDALHQIGVLALLFVFGDHTGHAATDAVNNAGTHACNGRRR